MRLSEDFSTLVPFYVVFQDETSLWWLRLLKPGFRHCYVLYPLAGGGSFLELNPLSNCFLVRRLTVTPAGDYLRRLRRRGCTVCRISQTDVPVRPAPWGPFTCVEFVKRLLGIRSWFIITPFQLYKNIKNCRKKVLTL